MNTDQAFFAAYGQPVVTQSRLASSSSSRESRSSQSDRQPTGPAIDKQYFDGSWYRIDQRHTVSDGPPAPHLEAPRQVQSPPETSQSEAQSWDILTEWPASCVVMAAPMSDASRFLGQPKQTVDSQEPEAEPASTARIPVVQEIIEDELPANATTPNGAPESSGTPTESWTAYWEVDEFAWPDELGRLQEDQIEYFRYAGEKLRDASREGLKTLAVVTTREREGCTTMAICLARAAAAAGVRVALVDGNLDHPELGAKLGLDFSHGWQEAVSGTGSLAEAAVMALDSSLTLLPLSAAHRLATMCDPKVSTTLREIAAAFDLVIVDAGIAPAGAEMFESGAECPINAVLIVRDLRRTSETETLVTGSRLKSLGIDAIGIAENFSPRPGSQIAAA
jgi:Mrp family chromosome partitioning ATPase